MEALFDRIDALIPKLHIPAVISVISLSCDVNYKFVVVVLCALSQTFQCANLDSPLQLIVLLEIVHIFGCDKQNPFLSSNR